MVIWHEPGLPLMYASVTLSQARIGLVKIDWVLLTKARLGSSTINSASLNGGLPAPVILLVMVPLVKNTIKLTRGTACVAAVRVPPVQSIVMSPIKSVNDSARMLGNTEPYLQSIC